MTSVYIAYGDIHEITEGISTKCRSVEKSLILHVKMPKIRKEGLWGNKIWLDNIFFIHIEMKVIQERNVERIATQKDHQKAIENLRKEHKKELDVGF